MEANPKLLKKYIPNGVFKLPEERQGGFKKRKELRKKPQKGLCAALIFNIIYSSFSFIEITCRKGIGRLKRYPWNKFPPS